MTTLSRVHCGMFILRVFTTSSATGASSVETELHGHIGVLGLDKILPVPTFFDDVYEHLKIFI